MKANNTILFNHNWRQIYAHFRKNYRLKLNSVIRIKSKQTQLVYALI